MRAAVILLALALPLGVSAQGFFPDDGGPCYTWQGGNFSAGSFGKCGPRWVVAQAPKPPPPVAAPMAAPVTLPPMVSCASPPAKPVIKPKRRPPVKC